MRWSWERHPETSEGFGSALLNHIDLLSSFPHLGSPVIHRPGVRKLLHSPVRVYYRIRNDRKLIEVLHLWHAARRNPEVR
jgi:plasmid stabilization system protein ParE